MDEGIGMIPVPLTRAEALAARGKFRPRAREYATRRNHLEPGHANVSRLSAALRRRVRELRETLPREVLEKADAVAAGESGVACMDESCS